MHFHLERLASRSWFPIAMPDQDADVLNSRDHVVLDLLPPEPSPSRPFETVIVRSVGEAAFHQPFPSHPITPGRRGLRLGTPGVDLLPTVCDYAEVEMPAAVSGQSLRPLAEAPGTTWRDFAYVESNYWGRALITDRFKYVTEYVPKDDEDFVPPGPDSAKLGREQLFDRVADPGEMKNLAGAPEFADILSEHRSRLQSFERALARRRLHPRCENCVTHWADRINAYKERLQL